jgi:hypothetical protein
MSAYSTGSLPQSGQFSGRAERSNKNPQNLQANINLLPLFQNLG